MTKQLLGKLGTLPLAAMVFTEPCQDTDDAMSRLESQLGVLESNLAVILDSLHTDLGQFLSAILVESSQRDAALAVLRRFVELHKIEQAQCMNDAVELIVSLAGDVRLLAQGDKTR